MTTKNNAFKVTGKLPFWLAVPAVLIAAGLVLFFLLGFNPAPSAADYKSLVITHDPLVNVSESLQEDLRGLCEDEMEKAGLSFLECRLAKTEKGGQIEYTFAPETSNDALYTLWGNIRNSISTDEQLKLGVYTGSVHADAAQYFYGYLGGAAISASIALGLAFVYVTVRYRFSMGLTALIAGVSDIAVMLALTLIFRIPVTTALATAAIFAALYSILVSTLSFNKFRSMLKEEKYAAMPVTEAMDLINAQAVKRVFLLGGVSVLFFAVLAAFGGAAVLSFALPVICGVAASTFSGVCLSPALAAAFKSQGVKLKEKRQEKARLAKQREEEQKALKKGAKK